jgi:rfaE bifunctional protein nucleotidyltransferase chain/domain
MGNKTLTTNNVEETIKQITSPIILAGGCFDILHPGHIQFLSSAKKIGGSLVVLLESDKKIKRIKGNGRPINTQEERGYQLSALEVVDHVVLLPDFTNDSEYETLISLINPKFFAVTKNDPVNTYVKKYAQQLNAQVVEVTERLDKYSTSKIIKQLNT